MEVINKTDKNIFLKILKLILILGSLFFILKLFFFGGNLTSSGGFIRIGYSFEFDWTYASTIALLFLGLWIYIVVFYHERNRYLAIIFIFILSLLGKQMFYFVNSDFDFYYNTKTVSYMDENRLLTDFDEFVKLYDKHCLDEKDWVFRGKYKHQMCWGKIPLDFGNLEDYKNALDYFNKDSNNELYSKVYNQSIEKFGLETMIEEYRNDTFYGRIIYGLFFSDDAEKLLLQNIESNKLKETLIYYLESNNEKGIDPYTYTMDLKDILREQLIENPSTNFGVIY